jgi:hypothetical protein
MGLWNAAFAELVNEALKPSDDKSVFAPVLIALLDFDVHARLVAAGFSTEDGAQLMAAMLIDFMKKGQGATRQAKTRRNT